eukprot:1491346-Rhodomonas_salina.1
MSHGSARLAVMQHSFGGATLLIITNSQLGANAVCLLDWESFMVSNAGWCTVHVRIVSMLHAT